MYFRNKLFSLIEKNIYDGGHLMIYLDNAATTPVSETAIQTYVKASQEFFANPSSLHEQGEKVMQLLERCRHEISKFISAEADEIYFTSGGTESNIRALQSLFLANKKNGNHVITTKMEHPSVHSFFLKLEESGVDVTYMDVQSNGIISLRDLEETIRQDTILASIQHVNSEIGIIQPIEEIGTLLKKHGVLFHSDCVQSFGKLHIDVKHYPIDALSISSHKINGPKGVGGVYLSKEVAWAPVDSLTTHENGFRPGTINAPGIAAFTTAAADAFNELDSSLNYIWELRTLFEKKLKEFTSGSTIEGSNNPNQQLPHIIGIGIDGIEGQYMLLSLDRHGICISTGSACQAGKQDPSIAMKALNKSIQEAKRFFRVSIGRQNTREDIIKAVEEIKTVVYEREGINHVGKT